MADRDLVIGRMFPNRACIPTPINSVLICAFDPHWKASTPPKTPGNRNAPKNRTSPGGSCVPSAGDTVPGLAYYSGPPQAGWCTEAGLSHQW
jgi:hypothetical protein